MANNWYPQDKKELNELLENLMDNNKKSEHEIQGLIVPHAGYIYSGEVAGKAFSLLKNSDDKIKHAVILGPSHYTGFYGIRKLEHIETPLGKVKISEKIIGNEKFEKIAYEHSVDNQIPFLQKLNPEIEILPLVIGEISDEDAEEFAEKLSEIKETKVLFLFSTDLSHFLPYAQAIKTDEKTIDIIENLDINKVKDIDACGIFPLMIMMHLCKIKKLKPRLIEYKNSGDITGDKSSVVGYASFWF